MTGMATLWLAVMIVGLIIMIICNKKQKTNPAMQPVSIVVFIVVIVAAGLMLNEMGVIGGGNTSSIIDSELTYNDSRANQAAKLIAKAAPGKKLLVIAYPGYEKDPNSARLIEAIKSGFGGEVEVDSFTIPANQAEMGMPFEEMLTAKDFDQLIEKHAGIGAVLSVPSLPRDARKMKSFRGKNAPVFFPLNLGIGNGKFIAEKIKSGQIVGLVVPKRLKPEDYEIKAPSELDKAFAIRYEMVTKANFDKYKAQIME